MKQQQQPDKGEREMADKAESTGIKHAAQNDLTASRRRFMGFAGAAAVSGIALLASNTAQAAPGDGVPGATEVPRPPKLGPRAMLDNRFPVTFAGVPKATEVMIGYFTALGQRDLRGMAEYLHFPFGSFEGIDPVEVKTPEAFFRTPPPSMSMNTHPKRFTASDSYMKEGSYDVFRGIEVIASEPVNVVFAMSYDRYDDRGKRLLRCEGVYSVTNNDGRWAIQLMSTIFTPNDLIGIAYPDAIAASVRSRIDHDLAYQVQDIRYDHPPQEGARAGIGSGSGGAPFWMGPEGKIMESYGIKGVKSRLRMSPPDAPRLGQVQQGVNAGGSGSIRLGNRGVEAYMQQYRDLFPAAGLPEWGWVSGIGQDSRVIHATSNKVHIFGGALRYSTAGEFLNANFDLRIMTYKNGFWGSAGSLIYMTPHDRSNDVLPA
jgi:hypothetical protein